MFQIKNTIISEDILEKDFVCNLSACKGQCCVDGEAGAPLEKDETEILKNIKDKVVPYMRPEGVAAIEKQGTSVVSADNELETPLVNGAECAYVFFDNEVAHCAIEKAYNEGEINWKKPISCHLYPVRHKEYKTFTAINYHKWDVCDAACKLGAQLQLPIYKFVKEALVRKFGEKWYQELEKVAETKS